MRIDAIAIGNNTPDDVNVIIEVPIGGEPIKYEMDKAAGTLVVDRFLHTPMRYPGNYGFVPHTLSRDGDLIDVLVAKTRSIFPGAVINVRPIGVLKMQDEGGTLAEPSRARLVLPVINEVVDHGWISQGRSVAEIGKVSLRDLAQDSPHDFA